MCVCVHGYVCVHTDGVMFTMEIYYPFQTTVPSCTVLGWPGYIAVTFSGTILERTRHNGVGGVYDVDW